MILFKARLVIFSKDIAEGVRSTVDSVKFEMCHGYRGGAAQECVMNVVTALKKNPLDATKASEMYKSINDKLSDKVKPPALSPLIWDEKAYWISTYRYSLWCF